MFNYNYDYDYIVDSSWISATKTRNYILDDPLIDYLKYTNKLKRKREDTFLNLILDNGLKFEENIIKILREKFPNKITTISIQMDDIRNPLYFKKTIDAINNKDPIIYQGVLHNPLNKTFGAPDLIVRGDYINKIINNQIDNINNDAYYIIDIKNSLMHLSAKSDNLLNNQTLKPYKAQLLIYCQILNQIQIQNTNTNMAFVMGSKWVRHTQNKIIRSSDPFDRLGIIDYANNDISYIKLVEEAVAWNKLIHNQPKTLCHTIPNHKNLYPNMCNQLIDPVFKKIKLDLALKNYEITSLWMCGIKHRNNALKHNIDRWNDPQLNSKILGINGQRGKTLDLILDINRSTTKIIHPPKIKSNFNNWKSRDQLAFYIDFETINTTIFDSEDESVEIIFMIGIGYSVSNIYYHKTIIALDLSNTEQIRIINEMLVFIKEISILNHVNYLDVNLYHWSNFEPNILCRICNNLNIEYPNLRWTDILILFHTEPIIIKGALDFSLKSVGKALYKLKLIKTIWPKKSNNISDGLEAMYEAFKIYQQKTDIIKKMKQITLYNKIDCKIMWDILNAIHKIA